MRKFLLFATAGLLAVTAKAQVVSTFESLSLSRADTFYLNYSQPGQDVGFNDGAAHFPCVYDTAYGGTWTGGFAFSNKTDSVHSGYTNQYSAKAGIGYNGSSKYAVYFQGYGAPVKVKETSGSVFNANGFYINNSTYAYNSMLKGDAFPAKKFGGATGNDADFFKLTVRGYRNGVLKPDSVEFYLADFRAANNTQDYIVRDWRWVNLMPLGTVDALTFSLSSSDNDPLYGMNTPAYFCMDDFTATVAITGVANIPAQNVARVYPNPATDLLAVDVLDANVKTVRLMDMSGRVVAEKAAESKTVFSLTGMPNGLYMLQLANDKGQTANLRVVKQ